MNMMNFVNLSSFTFVVLCIKLVLFLTIRSFRFTIPHGQLPPGPKRWPIMGNLVDVCMNRPSYRWFHNVMEDMKTEIACFRLGCVHVITVTSSEIAREVVKDDVFADRVESYSSNLISEGYKDVIFSSYGERWKLMKKLMVTKLMSTEMLKKSLSDRTIEADNMVAHVFNICHLKPERSIVNVRDITSIYSHGVMMRMMFGRRHFEEATKIDGGLGLKEKEHIDAIYRAIDCFFSSNVSNYIPFLRGWNIDGEEAQVREAIDTINKCNDPIIHERIALWREKGGKETVEDWLDALITLKDDQGIPLLTFVEIRAQCKDINIAAIDNTMNNVEWTIAEMLNHPKILERATEELDMVVGKDRLVEESDIPQLNYIKACSRESFRLHPANAFMPPHVARKDTTLAGYFVPKGSHILMSRLGLGQNRKIWDEPNVFKPERHIDEHGVNSVSVSLMESDMRFVTFGTGRRGCVGSKIGTSMTIMLLARLLQGFEWSHLPGTTKVDLIPADRNLFIAKSLCASVKPRLAQHVYPKVQTM